MKILVVDDFATMRRIIKNFLVSLGYNDIVMAEDGRVAANLLDSHNFDLVVTDWNMPNMNGLELLEYIRGHHSYRHIPVLMVTAEQKREQIIQAAHAGVNGYIIKPFTAGQLKEKLDKINARLRK